MKKSSWWTTQQLGSAPAIRLVRVVLPPLVTLRGEAGGAVRAEPSPAPRPFESPATPRAGRPLVAAAPPLPRR